MMVKLLHKFLIILIIGMLAAHMSFGQKILVFENVYNMKNYKYRLGQSIGIKIDGRDKKITDEIVDLTDSSMILNFNGEVHFADISAVYRERYWIDLLSGFSMVAGVFYFSVDSFNRMINSEWPIVDEQTLIISAGLVAFGGLLIPIRFRKIQSGENWKFKTIYTDGY